jgi:YhcH/YjgK/YiaL family protein
LIIGTLNDIKEQIHQTPLILSALDYLSSLDPDLIQDGKYTVKDDEIYAIIESFKTNPIESKIEIEGHKKYIDIYFIISGSEKIGWISVDPKSHQDDYDVNEDVWKNKIDSDRLSYIILKRNDVSILFPSDAHVSNISSKGLLCGKKVILKVAVSSDN